MDNLLYHLGHLPRSHPNGLPVQDIGLVLKTQSGFLHKQRFPSLNFSLILEGGGTFQVDNGPRIRVRPPCVLTQSPGHTHSYGPGPGKQWRELYFIFPADTLPEWTTRNLYAPPAKFWPVAHLAAVEARIQSLLHALEERDREGMADVIDRLCELLILESHRSAPPRNLSPVHAQLYALREQIDLHPDRTYDFPQLARTCGCGYSTFRRDWKILFGKPPGKYLIDRRLQEARRLLVESDLSIGEIANRLGFEDALYFSRQFHERTGNTAGHYRRIHTNGGTVRASNRSGDGL